MSALTRSRKYDRVEFKDPSGKVLDGIVLYARSDCAMVGVQSKNRPEVGVRAWDRYTKSYVDKSVPNNQLWIVPFKDIIRTLHPTLESAAE